MKKIIITLYSALACTLLVGCHSIEDYDNNARGNFEALWTILNEHYCFFQYKDVDWNEVHDRYSAMISNQMTSRELFDVCATMLDELRDGHTNLAAPFNTSYYTKWWSDYPQNYNERLVEQYYFNFNYMSLGTVQYGILSGNIGYIRYGSFETDLGDGNWNWVFNYLATCDGLIIDVRNNGGGTLTNVEPLISHFITERTLAGFISHKTGPGHNDFSEPFAYYYEPAPQGSIQWQKPVAVLTNRSTFSAANNFVSIMKLLPQVYIVGAQTGGGCGMPFSSELPNGWGVRFSSSVVTDAQGHLTEFGVDPTPGCEVDLDEAAALDGHDTMIDFAVNLLYTVKQ